MHPQRVSVTVKQPYHLNDIIMKNLFVIGRFLPLHYITTFKLCTTLNLEISFCEKKKKKKSVYLKLVKNINTLFKIDQ